MYSHIKPFPQVVHIKSKNKEKKRKRKTRRRKNIKYTLNLHKHELLIHIMKNTAVVTIWCQRHTWKINNLVNLMACQLVRYKALEAKVMQLKSCNGMETDRTAHPLFDKMHTTAAAMAKWTEGKGGGAEERLRKS